MKIIKIAQENEPIQENLKCHNCGYFFAKPYNIEFHASPHDIKSLKCPICGDLIFPGNIKILKNAILEYYKKYINQSPQLNKKILDMMDKFKDDDFVISVLYDDLYKKVQEYNKELEKELEKIKLEQYKPRKKEQLLNFYSKAYANVGKDELDQVKYDIMGLSNEGINYYIDKYITSWKNI